MKKFVSTVLILFVYSTVLFAADLKTYQATYHKQMADIGVSHGMKMTKASHQYTKDLDSLLSKAKKAGDLDKTTAVMDEIKRFGDEKSMPAKASSILDIQSLQSAYTKLASISESDKARKIVSLTTKYEKALDGLQKKLVRSSELDDAKAVQAERKALTENVSYKKARAIISGAGISASTSVNNVAFNWEKDKKRLTYSYARMASSKETTGSYSYADASRKKLLDGIYAPKIASQSAGWRNSQPPDIKFRFLKPVKPAWIRIYAFGNLPNAGTAVTSNIKVYTGIMKNSKNLVGHAAQPPNATGWIEVPLDLSSPSQSFLLELSRSSREWVLIDEVEFR